MVNLARMGSISCAGFWATEPEEVFAYGENFMHKGEIESWDNVKALVRFGDGSLGSVHVCTSISWEYPFFDLEVVGEEGCLRTDYHNYPVVTQGKSSAQLAPIRYAPMNQREIAHFVKAVRGEEELRVTLEDAYVGDQDDRSRTGQSNFPSTRQNRTLSFSGSRSDFASVCCRSCVLRIRLGAARSHDRGIVVRAHLRVGGKTRSKQVMELSVDLIHVTPSTQCG